MVRAVITLLFCIVSALSVVSAHNRTIERNRRFHHRGSKSLIHNVKIDVIPYQIADEEETASLPEAKIREPQSDLSVDVLDEQNATNTAANETLCKCKSDTSTENKKDLKESGFSRLLDPGKAIATAYQNSRHKIEEWMDQSRSNLYFMSALIGGFAAVFVILCFYGIRFALQRCRSKGRQFRTVNLSKQTEETEKLIDCKAE